MCPSASPATHNDDDGQEIALMVLLASTLAIVHENELSAAAVDADMPMTASAAATTATDDRNLPRLETELRSPTKTILFRAIIAVPLILSGRLSPTRMPLRSQPACPSCRRGDGIPSGVTLKPHVKQSQLVPIREAAPS
jgi:hypothetical protein